MPQLDVITFLSQYIWTMLSLLSLFVFVVLFLLPHLKANFKIRQQGEKEMISSSTVVNDFTILKKILHW